MGVSNTSNASETESDAPRSIIICVLQIIIHNAEFADKKTGTEVPVKISG
jgi:hypothetical protein